MSRRFISGVLILLMIIVLFADPAFAASALKVGSKGNDVKTMQQKLIELGYLNGKADGIFGPATRDAVIRFQRAKGLAVDGIAGPNTLNVLYGSNPPSNNQPPAQNPPVGTQPPNSIPTGVLKVGSRGEDVKQLQNRLNQLGFSCGIADGIFGNGTRNAVINFQRANGLAADGIAGPATLGKLFTNIPPTNPNPPAEKPTNPEPPKGDNGQGGSNIPPITQTLKNGSRGEQVKILQNKLNELGYSVGTADGIFGAKTHNAVIAFQKANGLVADGIVGAKTIEKLFAATAPAQPNQPNQPTQPNQPGQPGKPGTSEPNDGVDEFHGVPGQLAGKTIILDPGHGGWDVGANRNGVYEKDINLDMANRLKRMLEEAGAKVVMTRSSDQYYSLYYRSAFANKYILDNELSKKLQQKEFMEEQYKEKTEKKLAMERERLEKLARIDDLEKLLLEKKALESQTVAQISILSNKKLSLEQDWKLKKRQYDEKAAELGQAEQELNNLRNELAKLNQDRLTLEGEVQVIRNQIAQLQTQYQVVITNIAAIESHMMVLKAQIDSPEVDSEMKKQLQKQYDAKKAELDSLIAQKASIENSSIQVNAALKSKESEIQNVISAISDMEANISSKQSKLDLLNGELNVMESITQQVYELLQTAEEELTAKEQELDGIKEEIDSIEEEIPVLHHDIDYLKEEIPGLGRELILLSNEIRVLKTEADEIKNKGELFRPYLDNPALNERQGIYEADYSSVRKKNYINQQLKEIFDLTRANYEDDTIFIAIHCNSTAEEVTSASGIQAYYRDNGPNSTWGTYGVNTEYYTNYNAQRREKLARSLLIHTTQNTNFSGSYSSPYKQDFSVLRENNLVSVLMEIGFINNPNDRNLLTQEQTRENVAKGLYKGIVEYFR